MKIPKEVLHIGHTLRDNGHEAYLVGGCVRDILLGKEPKDWDITTNAKPEQITTLFEHSHYDNEYGTVRVINDDTEDERLKVIEVTTYRLETNYSDARHPDEVKFSNKLEDDLKRRDFTVNALALEVSRETNNNVIRETNIVDLFGGVKDLANGQIKAVGNPDDRFNEDALRILRAIRITAEVGFIIEDKTKEAMLKNVDKLKKIAKERIKDEFVKIIMSERPILGIELASELGILEYIAPELVLGKGVKQNQAHSYDVWEHSLRALQASSNKNFPLEIRLAALFHDIGKPKSRRWSEEKNDWTFHGHEVVGARVTEKILKNLKFSNKIIEKVLKLVRWHMFFSDTDQITLTAVRRMVNNVGEENIWDLMNVRIADRIGTGRPKEDPYRLRKYRSMVEEALRSPVSVKMLKIDGSKIMKVTQETPGPKIGHILDALMEEVLEDPIKNNVKYLEKRAKELSKMKQEDLKKVANLGKDRQEEQEKKEINKIKGKYRVK